MNKNIFLNLILFGLLLFGIFGAGALSFDEFQNGPICPTFFGIPACYIILVCFIGLSIIHALKFNSKYFYILALFPIAIALYGTIFQIFGSIECPKTDSGIPMCFISLAMFSSISFLKLLISKNKND